MIAIQRRTVSFNPAVRGVEIISIDDYAASEIAATWYSEEEMDRITQRCFRVLKKMETDGPSIKAKKYCTRGLEGHTTVGRKTKRMNRSTSIAAVLEEQARQWNENKEIDVDAIADAYKRTTSSCQMWAQVMGNRDQMAVELILFNQEENYCQEFDVNAAVIQPAKSRSSIVHSSSAQQRSLRQVHKAAGVVDLRAPAAAAC